jgi:DNA-binding response OmpR family regulator
VTSGAGPARVIAVVEDEPSIHQMLRTLLMRHGYVTVHADTLPQLRAVIQVQPIDAFIVDLRLKGEHSGLDVLTWIRGQGAHAVAPVLILTGVTQLADEDEAVIRKARAYVFYKGQPLAPILEYLDRLTKAEP